MEAMIFKILDNNRSTLKPAALLTEFCRMALVCISEKSEGIEEIDKKRIRKKIDDQKLSLSWGIDSYCSLNEANQLDLINELFKYDLEKVRKITVSLILKQEIDFLHLMPDVAKQILQAFPSSDELNIIFAHPFLQFYELINKRGKVHLFIKDHELIPAAKILFNKDIDISSYSDITDKKFQTFNFIHMGPLGARAHLHRPKHHKLELHMRATLVNPQETEIMNLLNFSRFAKVVALIPAGTTFSQSSREFREFIATQADINSLYELSSRAYRDTLVQTYLAEFSTEINSNKLKIQAKEKEQIEISKKDFFNKDDWNLTRHYSRGFKLDCEVITLGEVIKESFRGPLIKKTEMGEKLYVIQNKDLKKSTNLNCDDLIEEEYEVRGSIERYLLQDGDIVIVCRGYSFDATVLINVEKKKVVSSSNLLVIRPNPRLIDSQFIYHFLNSPLGTAELQARQVGSTQIILSTKEIKSIEIPLLSLAEQRDISFRFKEAEVKKEKALKEVNENYSSDIRLLHSRMGILKEN